MSAFLIFHSTVTDPETFSKYASGVAATLQPFGGSIMAKGKRAKVLAGEQRYENVGIIRFPDLDKAHEWYASGAYQALIPLRDAAADVTATSYADPSL